MNNDWKFEIILNCLALVVAIAVMTGAVCAFKFASCHFKASKQELECSYNPLQGCMVKIDGKWIDYDRLRVME